MPTIKANLIVEFEADTPVQEAIDIALDQVLLLQPSCKLVSKTILEIDGEALNRENPFIHATTSTEFRHSLTTRRNGAHGDSYRPEYSERDSPQRIDNYRPSSPHGLSFQPIDSYRPNDNVSSSSTGLHPGKNKLVESPEFMHYPTAADPQSLLSIGASELGTRYDALIDSLVFNPDPQSSRPKKSRGCRRPPSHYSPPRHNRSASPPSSELRRSERLRAAESGKGLVWPSERKLSLPEAHERRRWELEQRRKEEETEQSAAEPGSLEALAPKMVAKDVAASGRLKFAKQQEKHGVTEALRLKNLRYNQKIGKARLKFDKQRWGEGEVREGAKMDAIIDEIMFLGLDSGTNGNEDDKEGEHLPIETRKKKTVRRRGEGSLSGTGAANERTMNDHDMREVHVAEGADTNSAAAMSMDHDHDHGNASGGGAGTGANVTPLGVPQ